LEPLSGYLWLGANLSISSPKSIKNYAHSEYCSAFNFGPAIESNRSVGELVDEILKVWPGNWIDVSNNNTLHEANLLNLSTDKAYHYLGWKPIWNFQQTIMQTINWYRQADDTVSDVQLLTIGQIQNYIYDATQQGLAWTCK
jgi:CDP-glucose 4,6-dehydratase